MSLLKSNLEAKLGKALSDVDVMSAALYPKVSEQDPFRSTRGSPHPYLCAQVSEDFFRFREKYGPVDKLETRHFLVGPKIAEEFEVTIEQGKTLHFKTLACSTDLTAEGEREVFFELNGQLRSVFIKDKSVAAEMALHPKADRSIAGQVGCVCQINEKVVV